MMTYQLYKKFGGILLAAISVAMVACQDDESAELSQSVYPESITLNIPEEVKPLIYKDENGTNVLPLLKGETVQLGCTILPENVTFNEVVWASSDTNVAEVDPNGVVKAVNGDGSTYSVIQVSPSAFYSGSGIYGTLKVMVSNEMVKAESISLSAEADQVYMGESLQLQYAILPENTTYKTVKWSTSDESVATVDENGLVTARIIDANTETVTITASALDGSQVYASKQLTIMKVVQPEDITIDQSVSVEQNYVWAITDKTVKLSYTTVPADCTTSLIEWTSSNEDVATVNQGVVNFNQNGVFGDVTITATCPETGKTSSVKLRLEEGLVRELFHDENNYTWYNAKQSGNGTESSHEWHDGYLTVTTYTQTAGTKQRGDFKCWSPKTWLHAGKYPIFAIRMDDVADKYKDEGVTARNINLDAAGTCGGTAFSGNLGGSNNKYKYNYKCSDGSRVFVYDLSTQSWAKGGVLPGSVAEFTTLQFKYADIATIDHQIQYNVYWVQTFKTLDDLEAYLDKEGLTYEK